jgi:biopolymer transport protein ExbB
MPAPYARAAFFPFAALSCGPAFAQDINFFEQISGGGVAIMAIGALSVLALAVTFERLLHLREQAVAPHGLVDQVIPLWQAGQFEQVRSLVADDPSSLARILAFLVEHRHLDAAAMSSRAGDLASLELRLQQQKAYALGVVAAIAPIVGLLGTVIGMIEAFHVIAYAGGMGDPTLLAGGISKALVNTAAGLSVALPSLGMHHFFRNRLAGIGIVLERQLNHLLDECVGRAAAPSPSLQAVPHAH